jgi:hypothetical protein
VSDPVLPTADFPLLLKIGYTLFVAFLVPIYWWYYGPGNFLWFSDLALFLTLAALWLESSLLASTQAVSVGLLETIWLTDFLVRLMFGIQWIGLSGYMFDVKIPKLLRGLSLFHVVLPFLLFWLVWQLGYDGRAWLVQSLLAWAVLLMCYFLTNPQENVNWVFGWGTEKQNRLRPSVYLLLLMVFFPICIYLPTHVLLLAFFPRALS